MREKLKLKQSIRINLFCLEDPKYDVYVHIQSELLREALLGTRKKYPDKVITAIKVVFLTPDYRFEISAAGVFHEWYNCDTLTTVEIADPPEAGMFSKTLTFY